MFRALVFSLAAVFPHLAFAASAPAPQAVHLAPLQIVHAKPFVAVTINGKGPFRFVLDTGTGAEAFITPELVAQLALPETGQIQLNDPSGRGGRKVPTVLLQSLQVAGVEFTAVHAAVHDLGNGDGACEGLLGFALFRDYLLTIDYPNHRMSLASGNLKPDGQRSVLSFRISDGIPIVKLAIGSASIDAQLDSGGAGLSLPLQLASQFKSALEYTSIIDAHSLSTSFRMMGATLDSDVHLGSYTFKRPYVEINPAFPMASLGACPMQDFALTFDQKNGLVRLDARQRTHRLSATPYPMRLQNAPDREPADPKLVPVG